MKGVTFNFANRYGDELGPETIESYDDFDYDTFYAELGLEPQPVEKESENE